MSYHDPHSNQSWRSRHPALGHCRHRQIVTFSLIALAIVVLNPSKNFFEVEPKQVLRLPETAFWAILGFYWLFIIVWTMAAKGYRPDWPNHLKVMSPFIGILFLAQAFALATAPEAVQYWGRFVALGYLILYLTVRGFGSTLIQRRGRSPSPFASFAPSLLTYPVTYVPLLAVPSDP